MAGPTFVSLPKSLARSLALSGLAAVGRLTGLEANLRRPRVHFLYLHFVPGAEEEQFRRLLRVLSKDHRFISYSDAVARVYSGDIDRPYLTFSVDDGIRNGLRLAEILDEFGAKACFFVCDRIPELKHPAEIEAFCRLELEIPPTDFLSWDDMESLLRSGHEIGNHSARHRTLSDLSLDQLEDDIAGGLERLRSHFGDAVRDFAWPRGRFFHMSADAAAVVFRSGHSSCASAERGCHVSRPISRESLCIRREHIISRWPLSHSMYFIARSAASADEASNRWPESLMPHHPHR
jgi:peptidoglycan/xylan/chitin deacetylase (PgdA/CDA1 family)